MNGILKFLSVLADALDLLVSQIKSRTRAKERDDVQKSADSVDFDPAGEFMRRFKRGQSTANTTGKAEPGKPDDAA